MSHNPGKPSMFQNSHVCCSLTVLGTTDAQWMKKKPFLLLNVSVLNLLHINYSGSDMLPFLYLELSLPDTKDCISRPYGYV